MNVLSLFDGISCARVALDRAGIEVNAYMSAEIEKNAIKISDKNYPDIIRVGSVVGLEVEGQVDLLIGGSPCQDLSIAKKDRKGLEGNRSGLFWEYVRVKNECKPTYFILENVASMPKADRDIITREMGVEPVMFNASLVSAQCRKRLFWTNIPFTLPEDRNILLKDILQPEVGETFYMKKGMTMTSQTGRNETKKLGYVTDKDHQANRVYDDNGKLPALASVCNSMIKVGHIGTSSSQGNRVYDPEGKSVTLSANGGGCGAKTGLYYVGAVGTTRSGMEGQEHLSRAHHEGNRIYDAEGKSPTLSANGGGAAGSSALVKIRGRDVILTESPLQVLQEGRTELGKQSRKDIKKETGKDSTSRSTEHKAYFGKDGTKANCLTTALGVEGLVVKEDRIRKLTPIECERLQGLPDNYTEGIAMTNRYKCLGNAFNVDVVTHILSHLK
jgi:DNA (cytosine-5)-methyltransferase 3A